MKRLIVWCTKLGIIGFIPVLFADIVVVVNSSNTINSLSQTQVKNIFLGTSNKFPNGQNASPADQKEDSEIRNSFYEKVVNKDAGTMRNYWSRMIFSGEAVPPKSLDNGADVASWVSSAPNGIGYISSSEVTGKLKIVYKVE